MLSLDCFDTILWRKTAAPTDVFYDLQRQPMFRSLGFTASLRIHAEIKARQMMMMRKQQSEVKLRDIYLESYPGLDDKQLEALAEEELSTEMNTCFALPQIIELILNAHQRGLNIIITSDTYLAEHLNCVVC